jgi:hypothetical protein
MRSGAQAGLVSRFDLWRRVSDGSFVGDHLLQGLDALLGEGSATLANVVQAKASVMAPRGAAPLIVERLAAGIAIACGKPEKLGGCRRRGAAEWAVGHLSKPLAFGADR